MKLVRPTCSEYNVVALRSVHGFSRHLGQLSRVLFAGDHPCHCPKSGFAVIQENDEERPAALSQKNPEQNLDNGNTTPPCQESTTVPNHFRIFPDHVSTIADRHHSTSPLSSNISCLVQAARWITTPSLKSIVNQTLYDKTGKKVHSSAG